MTELDSSRVAARAARWPEDVGQTNDRVKKREMVGATELDSSRVVARAARWPEDVGQTND